MHTEFSGFINFKNVAWHCLNFTYSSNNESFLHIDECYKAAFHLFIYLWKGLSFKAVYHVHVLYYRRIICFFKKMCRYSHKIIGPRNRKSNTQETFDWEFTMSAGSVPFGLNYKWTGIDGLVWLDNLPSDYHLREDSKLFPFKYADVSLEAYGFANYCSL